MVLTKTRLLKHDFPVHGKRMGGGKRTENALSRKFLDPSKKSAWSALSCLFVQEKQSTDT